MIKTSPSNCITGSLDCLNSWGNTDQERRRNIQHLFHRMTFGATVADINWALCKTPCEVVDILIDRAIDSVPAPGLDVHAWADKNEYWDNEMQEICNSGWTRTVLTDMELAYGMIGKNSPNDAIYDQEIDRAKRFKYKLSYYWQDHFAINRSGLGYVTASGVWYNYTLIHNALGNFKTFVKDIGLTSIMMLYLNTANNLYNHRPDWEPNQNYARELLELFTMGVATGNDSTDYTQTDIEELAKVFTGWRYNNGVSPSPVFFREYLFQPNLHYWAPKTIFGHTLDHPAPTDFDTDSDDVAYTTEVPSQIYRYCDENRNLIATGELGHTAMRDDPWVYFGDKDAYGIREGYAEYEEAHDIIFGDNAYYNYDRQLRIAKFICSKLYRDYIYNEVCEATVEGLAHTFIQNDWELAPVLRQLFKSEHFFSAAAHGAQIQSPLGSFFSFFTALGMELHVDYFTSIVFYADHLFDINKPYSYLNKPLFDQQPYPLNQIAWEFIQHVTRNLDHIFFQAPNVGGWEGHHDWLNESRLIILGRSLGECLETVFDDYRSNTMEKWRQLMKDLVQEESDYNIPNAPGVYNNPDAVVRAVAKHFILADLTPAQLHVATCAFKESIPNNHYAIWHLDYDLQPPIQGTPDEGQYIKTQFITLMKYLVRLPENFMT